MWHVDIVQPVQFDHGPKISNSNRPGPHAPASTPWRWRWASKYSIGKYFNCYEPQYYVLKALVSFGRGKVFNPSRSSLGKHQLEGVMRESGRVRSIALGRGKPRKKRCLVLTRRLRPIIDLKCTSRTPIDLKFCCAASRSSRVDYGLNLTRAWLLVGTSRSLL